MRDGSKAARRFDGLRCGGTGGDDAWRACAADGGFIDPELPRPLPPVMVKGDPSASDAAELECDDRSDPKPRRPKDPLLPADPVWGRVVADLECRLDPLPMVPLGAAQCHNPTRQPATRYARSNMAAGWCGCGRCASDRQKPADSRSPAPVQTREGSEQACARPSNELVWSR